MLEAIILAAIFIIAAVVTFRRIQIQLKGRGCGDCGCSSGSYGSRPKIDKNKIKDSSQNRPISTKLPK